MRVHLLVLFLSMPIVLLACGRIVEEVPDSGQPVTDGESASTDDFGGAGHETDNTGGVGGADNETDNTSGIGGADNETDNTGGRLLGDRSPLAGEVWPPVACSLAEQGVALTPTEEVFKQLLVGRWFLCSTVSVFGTSDEVGLEIVSDSRWYKLYDGGDGTASRVTGFDRMGTWEVIDTSEANGPGSFQLNLNVDGGGTVITHPVFATEPRKMRLNNMGVFVGEYAMDQSDRDSGSDADIPDPAQETCPPSLLAPTAWTTPQQLGALLAGAWILCDGGAGLFTPEAVGIEFREDGTWTELFLRDGEIVRDGKEGVWIFTDNGTGSGGDLAVGLTQGSDSGTTIYRPKFYVADGQMQIEHVGNDRRLRSINLP